jgi:hypothetical protein
MTVKTVFPITEALSQFFSSAPSRDAILAFRLDEAIEARALALLARNRDGDLTPAERAELDEFTRMGHFMNMVKAQARNQAAKSE